MVRISGKNRLMEDKARIRKMKQDEVCESVTEDAKAIFRTPPYYLTCESFHDKVATPGESQKKQKIS